MLFNLCLVFLSCWILILFCFRVLLYFMYLCFKILVCLVVFWIFFCCWEVVELIFFIDIWRDKVFFLILFRVDWYFFCNFCNWFIVDCIVLLFLKRLFVLIGFVISFSFFSLFLYKFKCLIKFEYCYLFWVFGYELINDDVILFKFFYSLYFGFFWFFKLFRVDFF